MEQCRRVVFYGCDAELPFDIETTDLPNDICEDEIFGRIKLATICGSDIHTLTGTRKETVPSVLGHEAVVEVTMSKRKDINPGDRITFVIFNSCHECFRCCRDMYQKCLTLYKYGHSHISLHDGMTGCYSTHIRLGAGTDVVKIPQNIPDSVAAPLNCAFATMICAIDQIPNNKNYKRAVIQGAGMLGIFGCVLLKERGFTDIYCIDTNETRLQMVSKFGGSPINANDAGFYFFNKTEIDVVIEVTGNRNVLVRGMELLRPGGFYLFLGLVHPDSELNITGEEIIRRCLTLIGIHNYRGYHLEKAVAFLSETIEKYPYKELVSEPFSLEEFQTAIEMAKSHKFMRVAIKP